MKNDNKYNKIKNKDKLLGCIVGHILGDGSIDKRYMQPSYNNKNKDLINEFYQAVKEVFKFEPRIWIQTPSNFKNKSVWIKRVNSIEQCPSGFSMSLFYRTELGRKLNNMFDNLAVGKSKKISKKMFNMSNDFKRALIKAFFDDEGNVGLDYYIRVFQDNKEMLNNISKILNELGIATNPIRFYIKRNKERYYFNITGYENFINFNKLIGFTSKIKQDKLNKLIKKVKNSKTFRLPNGKSRGIILSIIKKSDKPVSTPKIISELKEKYPNMRWSDSSVRRHLKILVKDNKIKCRFFKKTYFWYTLYDNNCNI
jgi:hypothetical protein